MKLLICGLTLMLSVTTLACEPQEAQFIGKVKNYSVNQRSETTAECYFQIDYIMLNPSSICPLVIGEVSLTQFPDMDCSMKNGDNISGVLTKKGDVVIIE